MMTWLGVTKRSNRYRVYFGDMMDLLRQTNSLLVGWMPLLSTLPIDPKTFPWGDFSLQISTPANNEDAIHTWAKYLINECDYEYVKTGFEPRTFRFHNLELGTNVEVGPDYKPRIAQLSGTYDGLYLSKVPKGATTGLVSTCNLTETDLGQWKLFFEDIEQMLILGYKLPKTTTCECYLKKMERNVGNKIELEEDAPTLDARVAQAFQLGELISHVCSMSANTVNVRYMQGTRDNMSNVSLLTMASGVTQWEVLFKCPTWSYTVTVR